MRRREQPQQITTRQIVSLARNGDADALRALRLRPNAQANLTQEQLREIATGENNRAFLTAIENSFANVLQELREGYGLTGDDARTNENEGLRALVTTDDVLSTTEILRELRDGYGLDVDDVRESAGIETAATFGNVDYIQAIREVFGIVDDDIRADNNAALNSAASGDHSHFMRYLRENFGLSVADARDNDNTALISAASAGHIRALRELLFGFGLTLEDARSRDNQALFEAVENRQNEAVTFLIYGFGLTPRDVSSRDNLALRTAVQSRDQALFITIRRFQTLSDEERRRQQASFLQEQRRIYENGNEEDDGAEEDEDAEPPPPDAVPTQTETTTFNISPPFSLENYNYETGTCFDFVAFDYQAAREYLQEDADNVIMVNVAEEKALCFTKSRLREIASDPGERFVECLGPIIDEAAGEKGQRWIPENPPLYVKVPSDPESGGNAFLPYENIMEAVSSRERIFCIVPLALGDGSGVQASFTHTITEKNWRQLAGFSYVSSNHCQRGSNILLYKFVKCRFAGLSRAPSWTLDQSV